MKKYFYTLMILGGAITCFSQTTKQQLDKAKKDPRRVENAAKADARLINQKNIVDTTRRLNSAIPKRKKPHKKVYGRANQ